MLMTGYWNTVTERFNVDPSHPKAFCVCLQVDLRSSQHRSIEVRIPFFIRLSMQQVVAQAHAFALYYNLKLNLNVSVLSFSFCSYVNTLHTHLISG